jgi:hypothetical protein
MRAHTSINERKKKVARSASGLMMKRSAKRAVEISAAAACSFPDPLRFFMQRTSFGRAAIAYARTFYSLYMRISTSRTSFHVGIS